MPIAITNFRIQKDFEDSYLVNTSNNYTNNSIIKIIGKVRRTPNDNIIFLLYYGLREDYNKNRSIKINVDNEGNFESVINLIDGEGKYLLTAKLLLDDGEYDLLHLNCFYKLSNPLINDFRIDNFDLININPINAENIYIINGPNKNDLKITFTSFLDDLETKYFYKLWLSNQDEPNFILPLNKTKINENINISSLTNGEYLLYLKVIDLSENESFRKIKININKTKTDVNINYLQLINKDYYIDLNKESNEISLLTQIKKGINIKLAEYRIYENNKILSPKNISNFNNINQELTEQLKNSGFFYLKKFDINEYFDLLDGEYNIEIFYKDIFDKEYVSNKVSFVIKSNSPELYTDELDLNNISSLILNDTNKIKFYLKDDFFTINNKQIKVKMKNNLNEYITVASNNSNWNLLENNIWYTELNLFLDNNNVNFDGINFKYNMYEFSIENDYFEETKFIIPLIYKQKRNDIKLTYNYCFDENGKINNLLNYVNEHRNNAQFLIPNNLDFFNINIEIFNDVDFEEISSYKTHNNKIKLLINGEEFIKDFNNLNDIWIDVQLPDEKEEEHNDVYFTENENINFEISTIESYKNSKFISNISYFNIETFDNDRFQLENQEIYCLGLEEEVLIEFPKSLDIKDSSFLNKKIFNDNYSYINIKKQNPFNLNSFKELEFFDCKLYELGNNQKEINYTFNVNFLKDLSLYFKDKIITQIINKEKFNILIPYPFENIENELFFYFDCLNEYKEIKELKILNNSHNYNIVNIDNKKYFEFIDLDLVKFLNEGKYFFNCFYKYKNHNKINSFKIEYDFKLNKNFVNIKPLTNIFNINQNNFIEINLEEIEISEINKIKIYYNNIVKEEINNINDTRIIHLINNDFLNSNTIIKCLIEFKNLTTIFSNIINIKTILNLKIINISMNKNKFSNYNELCKTRLQFIPYINSELLIKTKLIKHYGLTYNNELNSNDNFELILKEFRINKKKFINISNLIENNLDNGYYQLCFEIKTENNKIENHCLNFYISDKKLSINSISFISNKINSIEQKIEINHNANVFDNFEIYYEIENKKKILKNNIVIFNKDLEIQNLMFYIKNKINGNISEFNEFSFQQIFEQENKIYSDFNITLKENINIFNKEFKYDLIKDEIIYYNNEEFNLNNLNENLFVYINDTKVINNKINIFDLKNEIKIIDFIDDNNSFESFKALRDEKNSETMLELINEFILNNPQKLMVIKPKKIIKLINKKNINLKIILNDEGILKDKQFNHLKKCHLLINSPKEKIIKNKIIFDNYFKLLNSKYFINKEFEYEKFYFDLAMIKLKSESIFNKLNNYQKELIVNILAYEFYKIFPNPLNNYDNKLLNNLKFKLNVLQINDIKKILNGVDILNENLYL